ncbi:MAG TPA: uracil-DNA glycosylase family protein [Candidatus Angelobacter sp.]
MGITAVGPPNDVIDRLRAELAALTIANPKLKPFTGLPVMTHAFFPGGNGLYDGIHATRMPIGGTVILGSNFGCVSKFINAQGKLLIEDERSNPAWKPLLENLTLAAIDVRECFFTNAWPLLHLGESNRGPVRQWLNDPALMASCVPFFHYTLAILKPSFIVALGTGPGAFLSHTWPNDLSPWRTYSLKGLDHLPWARVRFKEQTIVCVVVTHPSMHNARRRKPPYQHRAGEIRLLTEARAVVGKK